MPSFSPPLVTPVGYAPVQSDPAVLREYPAAALWDLATRDVPLDADGLVEATHPVDAQVSIGLGFRQGTIAGDPSIGHTFHLVSLAQSHEQLQRDVAARVRSANPIGSLLAARDIEIDGVAARRLPSGLEVVTRYRNLRTGKAGRVTSG